MKSKERAARKKVLEVFPKAKRTKQTLSSGRTFYAIKNNTLTVKKIGTKLIGRWTTDSCKPWTLAMENLDLIIQSRLEE